MCANSTVSLVQLLERSSDSVEFSAFCCERLGLLFKGNCLTNVKADVIVLTVGDLASVDIQVPTNYLS